jgi:fatty-acyl-CoA synthase
MAAERGPSPDDGWAGPLEAGLPAGLMQDVPLTLELILRRLETVASRVSVTSVFPAGTVRHTWGELASRSRRLITALEALGLAPGARVATLAWNSHRHLELFYAVPCSGRVLHTLNARVAPARLLDQLERCGDAALFIDASLTEMLADYRDRLPPVVVVMDDGTPVAEQFAAALRYDDLLEAAAPARELGPMSEGQALCICHTSGTTGAPRAVVYSHRSVVLHALGALSIDNHAVCRGAVVLPLTPMFHLMAWGFPYSAGLAPAALVLGGADTSPEALAMLIERERVTLAAGVPTFWVRLIDAFEDPARDFSSLRRVLSGGSATPRALAERYRAVGVELVSGWGMTEAGSGTTLRASADIASDSRSPTVRQGAPIAGMELRIVDADGHALPWDDRAVGELQARGPWVARAYLDPEDDANERAFDDGWLRTGDVARIDASGSVELVDRLKDLVKSGGEWISSTELEGHLARQPAVAEAAVIAVADERWGERPLALLVARVGEQIDVEAVRAGLAGAVERWWVPERIEVLAELPKTSVGKVDKQRLRERFAGKP